MNVSLNFPNNTRFNPTINGPLHLGHLYMILVNEFEAHNSGGEFSIRFDDTQSHWCEKINWQERQHLCEEIKEDLEWLGIKVKYYISQSSMDYDVKRLMYSLCHKVSLKIPKSNILDLSSYPDVVQDSVLYYPYNPYLTMEKVIMDYLQNITLLVRGSDLLGEYSLYSYFREELGFGKIRQIFLPRLSCDADGKTQHNSAISKTKKNYRII